MVPLLSIFCGGIFVLSWSEVAGHLCKNMAGRKVPLTLPDLDKSYSPVSSATKNSSHDVVKNKYHDNFLPDKCEQVL